jgi:hypothetical protein
MEWNVLVIKLLSISDSCVMVLRRGKGTLYLIYALYHQAACRISTSVDILLFDASFPDFV